MKLWIDNYCPAPEGYVWCKTTNEAKTVLTCVQQMQNIEITENLPVVEIVDIGDYVGECHYYGGHFIEVLKFIEKNRWNFPVHLHGKENMEIEKMFEVVRRNGWQTT